MSKLRIRSNKRLSEQHGSVMICPTLPDRDYMWRKVTYMWSMKDLKYMYSV